MVHEVEGGRLQATLLNFSGRPVAADVTSQFLPPGAVVSDVSGSSDLARVDRTHSFTVPMHPHQGRSLVFGT